MSQGNLAGQTLGQYQLRELLGVGGMGAVYRAYQVNLKREVAVKIISSELVNNPELIARFIREAEISARLEHENIIPIYDFGTQGGITYVVMRLLTGGSLARRMEQRVEDARPLISLGETADLLRQVASALDYAHSYNVIHRDIKPANIMFDNQGKPYVVDFGIAKLMRGSTAFTQTGVAMGTPNFMPPEQWRGEQLTPQADQYSLGVMMYQLLTGRAPFDGDSAFVLMHKHLNEQPTPLNVLRPDIPPTVMMVINRAIAKDYRQRFQSCTAFAQAFEAAIEGNRGQPTGMFVFKVRPSQTNMVVVNRPYTSIGMGMGYNTPMPSRPNSQNLLIRILGLTLILVTGLLLLFISSSGGDNDTSLSTQIAGGIGAESATSTAISFIDETQIQISLENEQTLMALNATNTAQKEQTASVIQTETVIVNLSQARETATQLAIALSRTDIPSNTPTLTKTLDVRQAARATTDQIATQTAESWTATPTPDIEATIVAEVTLIYFEQLTMTATLWTATPTPTNTFTPTLTPTFTPTSTPTPTPTPTNTSTPTLTPTNTSTPTLTPTNTSTPTPTPSPTPTIPPGYAGGVDITANEQWTPVEREFDGVVMVLVPKGCFMMGSTSVSDEQPVHEQCFDEPFWIDKYEVTNKQFRDFGGVAGRNSNWTGDDLPRERITWFEARDFCKLRGGRLPTEREWEYAARGPNNLVYPWGNEFVADNVVYPGNSNDRTAPVGSREGGVSWVGAMDMSGNVWEWVSSLYVRYPYSDASESVSDNINSRVLRGGSWYSSADFVRSANRGRYAPSGVRNLNGFRCLRSQQ